MKTTNLRAKVLLGAALGMLIVTGFFGSCKHKGDADASSVPKITVTVKGGEHVNLTRTAFTVPKGSYWGTLLLEAMKYTRYEEGWELKCWNTDNSDKPLDWWESGHYISFDTDTVIYVKAQKAAPKVEGGISMIVSPDKKDITIEVLTQDGSPITVEGCNETEIPGNDYGISRTLTATDTTVILKGKIIKLYCEHNQLTSLNVRGCSSLQELSCSYNKLTVLDVQELKNLKELCITHSRSLTDINVSGCYGLECLDCGEGGKLVTLDVHGLKNLKKLYCSENQLTSLNIQGCTALTELECPSNRLTRLDVQGCRRLEILSCGECEDDGDWNFGNMLTSLDVHGLTALKELRCAVNCLTSLNIAGCTALEKIDCYANNLKEKAFIQLCSDLPQRAISDNARILFYAITDKTVFTDGNISDFTKPQAVNEAFLKAQSKNWKIDALNKSKP